MNKREGKHYEHLTIFKKDESDVEVIFDLRHLKSRPWIQNKDIEAQAKKGGGK